MDQWYPRRHFHDKDFIIDPTTGEPWEPDGGGLEAAHDALDHTDLPGVGAASMSILLREALGDSTYTVNSATYPVSAAWREFRVDFETVLWTHFCIWTGWSVANAAGQSIFMRLDQDDSGLHPLSGAADDLTITDTLAHHDSGWVAITRDMSAAGLAVLHLSVRGSNSTVDLTHQGIGVTFRRLANG